MCALTTRSTVREGLKNIADAECARLEFLSKLGGKRRKLEFVEEGSIAVIKRTLSDPSLEFEKLELSRRYSEADLPRATGTSFYLPS